MRRIIFILFISILCSILYSQNVKIGVIDTVKLFQQSKKISELQKQLQNLLIQKKSEIEPLQNKIQKLEQEINEKKSIMKKELLKKKQEELDDLYSKLRTKQEKIKDEISKKQDEMLKPLYQTLKDIITRIGQREGFTIIVEKDALLYNAPQIDITDEVIKELDKSSSNAKK